MLHFPRNLTPGFLQYIGERPERASQNGRLRRPKQQRTLIMRHNKCFSAAIALCVIAFFTIGWVPSASAARPTPVNISALFDPSTYPDETGNFTTSGALTISGPAIMHVDVNANGTIAHCVVTLIASDGTGTIIIHQRCELATSYPYKGRWQIVSGTGAYANLRGNGSLTMPDPPDTEDMTGVIR
jgi:hypothetical protein